MGGCGGGSEARREWWISSAGGGENVVDSVYGDAVGAGAGAAAGRLEGRGLPQLVLCFLKSASWHGLPCARAGPASGGGSVSQSGFGPARAWAGGGRIAAWSDRVGRAYLEQ